MTLSTPSSPSSTTSSSNSPERRPAVDDIKRFSSLAAGKDKLECFSPKKFLV